MQMLPELQKQFFAGIFDRETAIIDALLPSEMLTAKERLGIYHGSIFGLYTTALSEIYPVCKRLLGEKFFDALCDRYIPLHRSSSPNLQDYGKAFAVFLENFEPVDDIAYLPDVTRLEWAWHRAFHAADQQPLDNDQLAQLTEDEISQIVFQLPPGATLLQSAYPIDQIWQNNQTDIKEPPEIELKPGDHRLLIWRHGYEMRIDSLDQVQWRFLAAIQQAKTLFDISITQPELNLSEILPEAMGKGWLTDFTLRSSEDNSNEHS
jgi:hypothetical protein